MPTLLTIGDTTSNDVPSSYLIGTMLSVKQYDLELLYSHPLTDVITGDVISDIIVMKSDLEAAAGALYCDELPSYTTDATAYALSNLRFKLGFIHRHNEGVIIHIIDDLTREVTSMTVLEYMNTWSA